jgi:hypothetical protein
MEEGLYPSPHSYLIISDYDISYWHAPLLTNSKDSWEGNVASTLLKNSK